MADSGAMFRIVVKHGREWWNVSECRGMLFLVTERGEKVENVSKRSGKL